MTLDGDKSIESMLVFNKEMSFSLVSGMGMDSMCCLISVRRDCKDCRYESCNMDWDS